MNLIAITMLIFVAVLFIVEMSYMAYKEAFNPDSKKISKRLSAAYSSNLTEEEILDILQKKVLSEAPFLNRLLLRVPGIQRLDKLLTQARTSKPLGFFVLLALLLAVTGFVCISILARNPAYSLIASVSLGTSPFVYLLWKKNKRAQKLQKQLPDAMDMIARALRAGHAFTSGMKLAADEFDDPLGTEFEEALDEINFGIEVSQALKNLASRLDCHELRYFVVSTNIQRETGGNLAEILNNISAIIRERFKLQGRVRVLSAQGKISAAILIALPFLVLITLHFLNPAYISVLFSHTAGRIMLASSALTMLLGMYLVKRMITIDV
jgi:tight adherence protein B